MSIEFDSTLPTSSSIMTADRNCPDGGSTSISNGSDLAESNSCNSQDSTSLTNSSIMTTDMNCTDGATATSNGSDLTESCSSNSQDSTSLTNSSIMTTDINCTDGATATSNGAESNSSNSQDSTSLTNPDVLTVGALTTTSNGSKSNSCNSQDSESSQPKKIKLEKNDCVPLPLLETSDCQQIPVNGQIRTEIVSTPDVIVVPPKPPCVDGIDGESVRGRFGWTALGRTHMPYLLRKDGKFASVRIIERFVIKKFLQSLPKEVFNCIYLKSFLVTENEAKLLNEINFHHCDGYFGRESFTLSELLIQLEDLQEFYKFLDSSYIKLCDGNTSDKCGFIKFNSVAVPYVIKDGSKFVPLIYFERDRESLMEFTRQADQWDLCYLKFCCKVAGLQIDFNSEDKSLMVSINHVTTYSSVTLHSEEWWPIASKMPKFSCTNYLVWLAPPGSPFSNSGSGKPIQNGISPHVNSPQLQTTPVQSVKPSLKSFRLRQPLVGSFSNSPSQSSTRMTPINSSMLLHTPVQARVAIQPSTAPSTTSRSLSSFRFDGRSVRTVNPTPTPTTTPNGGPLIQFITVEGKMVPSFLTDQEPNKGKRMMAIGHIASRVFPTVDAETFCVGLRDTLKVRVYPATSLQLEALTHPQYKCTKMLDQLVLVEDLLKLIPQLKYMYNMS